MTGSGSAGPCAVPVSTCRFLVSRAYLTDVLRDRRERSAVAEGVAHVSNARDASRREESLHCLLDLVHRDSALWHGGLQAVWGMIVPSKWITLRYITV